MTEVKRISLTSGTQTFLQDLHTGQGPFLSYSSDGARTFKVTRTTFYEISEISHIGSIFCKSVCIRVVHIFETVQVLFSLCLLE